MGMNKQGALLVEQLIGATVAVTDEEIGYAIYQHVGLEYPPTLAEAETGSVHADLYIIDVHTPTGYMDTIREVEEAYHIIHEAVEHVRQQRLRPASAA